MTLRGALVRLHRWAGLAMAGFLILAGLTGSIITFDSDLDAWLNPELFSVPAGREHLQPVQIVTAVEKADPRIRVTYLPLKIADGEAAHLGVAPRRDPATGESPKLDFNEVFADPATGAILGTRKWGVFALDRKHIIPFLYEFHHTLTMPGHWGVWLMGGVSLIWVFDCFFGLYLTFPRARPFFSKWKPAWLIKRRAGTYRLNFDLHRASGLWMWAVLLALAVSGVYLNLYSEIFRPVVQLVSPITPTPYSTRKPRPPAEWREPAYPLEAAIKKGEEEAAKRGWLPPSNISHVRNRGFYNVAFRHAQYGRGTGWGAPRLYLDDQDGRVIGTYTPGKGTAGDLFAHIQLPLHSGEIAGLPGKIIVCISGIVVALLSITGVIIWWRKHSARRERSGRRQRDSAGHASSL